MKIAIIGAGTAGRAFALRSAAAGFDVALEDVMPEKLRRAQDAYAEAACTEASSGSLRLATTVEDAVHDADLAIDFVPDELESKLEIFSLLDRMAPPRTILCTPTNALSVTDLASCTYRPSLCVGLRGDLSTGTIAVLRTRFSTTDILATVTHLLQTLDIAVTLLDDVEEPMLVKNQLVKNQPVKNLSSPQPN